MLPITDIFYRKGYFLNKRKVRSNINLFDQISVRGLLAIMYSTVLHRTFETGITSFLGASR